VANEDLHQELSRLEERDALSEDDPKPRGALPALFRALRAAPSEQLQAGLARLAEQLADTALVTPTLELVRDLEQGQAFLDSLPAKGRYCVQDQVLRLHEAAPDPNWTLSALELLLGQGPQDWTELAVAAGPEETCAALEQLLKLRLRVPARRRDRTSALLAEGALYALTDLAPDLGPVQQAVAQILAAETRRAGKGEPTLALAALETMARLPVVERLRLLQRWGERLTRRKVLTRLEELRQAAEAELGLGPLERAELLARTGGLDPESGLVVVDLDEGGQVGVGLHPRAGLQRVELDPGEGPQSKADERALKSAEAEVQSAWQAACERLESALVEGRGWSTHAWRTIFGSDHPVWRALAPRVVWERRRGSERTWFRVDWANAQWSLQDVFGDALELAPEDQIGLAHPTLADPEELELWQEWALDERPSQAPFLQLFRPVLSREAIEAYDFKALRGRQLFRDEVTAWAKEEGLSGAPLVGAGSWELWSERRGLEIRLGIDPLTVAFKATLAQRKAAHRKAREGEKVVIRGHKEDQPRGTLGLLEIKGEASPEDRAVVRAEVLRALEALTETLHLPDELWLRAWQAEKWRDPGASWKEVVLRYREGSPARLAQRQRLLRAFAARHQLTLRLEDRFAITPATVVELGSGRCHDGPPKDYLPQWKVDERLSEVDQPVLEWPFDPARDPKTRSILEKTIGLIVADGADSDPSEPEN
jgi:uncharacterized protein DUF4132